MKGRTHNRAMLAVLLAALFTLALGAVAPAKMKSQRSAGICVTTGGGKFVDIPGFPGEKIDRRLLSDVRMLVRRYDVFITDGFSTSPIHSSKGEHPLGLALDIVPNKAAGGTWKKVDRLARWAEPQQDRPRAPFRWVGYDGDSGHGRGHHLHLSWNHGGGSFGKPVRTVHTLRCPGGNGGGGNKGGNGNGSDGGNEKGNGSGGGTGGVSGKGKGKGKDSKKGAGGKRKGGRKPRRNGGVKPSGRTPRRAGKQASGGLSASSLRAPGTSAPARRSSRETGGISAP